MTELSGTLNFLSWPTDVVNQIREVLASVNVPLSAFMAQALACIVFLAIAGSFFTAARGAEASRPRLLARIAVAACAVACLSIVASWVDHAANPRSSQITFEFKGTIPSNPVVSLLDYRGAPLTPEINIDSHGVGVIDYEPIFADPPSALVVSNPDCDELNVALTRAHLIAAHMTLHIKCAATPNG